MAESLNPDEIALLDSAIAESMPSVQPPAAARARILELIGELAKEPRALSPIRHARGVSGRIVSRDNALGTVAVVLQFVPGGVLDGHSHRGTERSYVVSGSCRVGEITLRQGDFHIVGAGDQHGDIVSDGGCVLLVTSDNRDITSF
jgi:quercetin dioxygenase-like cupin family protein